VDELDGARIDFGDGWALVRASNTQPVLSLRFEATSEGRLEELKMQVLGQVEHLTTELRRTIEANSLPGQAEL
jgi:phosphomannomutase/phosphoglucomutase